MIKQAFILAAGLGTRMRPLTYQIHKSMIQVGGKSIMARLLDQLLEYGVAKIVINTHYMQEQLIEHVNKYLDTLGSAVEIIFSKEPELLETGGGIINALSHLDSEPFFIVNSDSIFLARENIFAFLNVHWQSRMKALFLLCKHADATGYDNDGDYDLTTDGQLMVTGKFMPYIYIGAHISRPELFDGYPVQRIGLMSIYQSHIAGRDGMYGIKLPGKWLHVGTPVALDAANKILSQYSAGSLR